MTTYIKIHDIRAFDSEDSDERVHNAEQIIAATPSILEWPGRHEASKEIAECWNGMAANEVECYYDTDDRIAGMLVVVRLEQVGYTYDEDWIGSDQYASTDILASV